MFLLHIDCPEGEYFKMPNSTTSWIMGRWFQQAGFSVQMALIFRN